MKLHCIWNALALHIKETRPTEIKILFFSSEKSVRDWFDLCILTRHDGVVVHAGSTLHYSLRGHLNRAESGVMCKHLSFSYHRVEKHRDCLLLWVLMDQFIFATTTSTLARPYLYSMMCSYSSICTSLWRRRSAEVLFRPSHPPLFRSDASCLLYFA